MFMFDTILIILFIAAVPQVFLVKMVVALGSVVEDTLYLSSVPYDRPVCCQTFTSFLSEHESITASAAQI